MSERIPWDVKIGEAIYLNDLHPDQVEHLLSGELDRRVEDLDLGEAGA